MKKNCLAEEESERELEHSSHSFFKSRMILANIREKEEDASDVLPDKLLSYILVGTKPSLSLGSWDTCCCY